jgi:hypothetical protein
MAFMKVFKRRRVNLCFAGDSSLFQAGTKLHSIAESLESDLALVSEWLEHNRLLLNVKNLMQ